MQTPDILRTARDMIRRHGLRAQAMAAQRVAELRGQGQSADFEQWEQIYAVICELQRTRPADRAA
jgi:hypothetical protein